MIPANIDSYNTITGNSASNGGGIYNYNGTVNLNGGFISYNDASQNGGGISNDNYGTVNLLSGLVDHNTAGQNGGGIYSNQGTLTGNMNIVHDNTPDQINISVDWLPEA